jgi:DNA invertase Pin-like site-specific DNA recombinase
MMIGVLGSVAEYERELIKERTALKRATTRANLTKVRTSQEGRRP